MRPSAQQSNMEVALVVAKRATCIRRSVGCVLVDGRNHIIATGFNGRPAGWTHCNSPKRFVPGPGRLSVEIYPNQCDGANAPSGTSLEACEAIHAEQNALLQCGDVYNITACYSTASPCITCLKLLLNTSCQTIYYHEEYPGIEVARDLWLAKGGRTLFERIP